MFGIYKVNEDLIKLRKRCENQQGEMTASINDYIIKLRVNFTLANQIYLNKHMNKLIIKNGIDLIRKERDRQINEEGWDIDSDIEKT